MINVNRLKRDEILWLYNHYCKHRHRFIEHLNCIAEEQIAKAKFQERIGFLDIETTGLNANWDYIISWLLIDQNDKVLGRVLTPYEVRHYDIFDKNLVREFLESIKNFDRLVVYWGKDRRHDIPYLRTRCLMWGLGFPSYKDLHVTDLYDIAKNKLRLNSYRLQNVCDTLEIPAKQHRLDFRIWAKAKTGDGQSLKYIWQHNLEDVISLKDAWYKLERFSASRKLSI